MQAGRLILQVSGYSSTPLSCLFPCLLLKDSYLLYICKKYFMCFCPCLYVGLLISGSPVILSPLFKKSVWYSFKFKQISWLALVIDMMIDMMPRNKKCAVMSNYCMMSWRTPSDIYQYRWMLRVCRLLWSSCSPYTAHVLRVWKDYKLTSFKISFSLLVNGAASRHAQFVNSVLHCTINLLTW